MTDQLSSTHPRALSVVIGLALLLPVAPAWAEEQTGTLGKVGPIEQVEVLLDGAWITRSLDSAQIGALKQQQAEQDPSQSAPWLWLYGLPGGLQTDSIVLTRGGEALTTPLRLETVPAEETIKFKVLADEIQSVSADQVRNQSGQERVNWRLDLLKARLSQPSEDQIGHPDSEQIEQQLDDLLNEKTRLRLVARQLEQTRLNLKQQQQEVLNRGARYRLGLAKTEIKEVLGQDKGLQLRYRVADARWQPRYRAELNTTNNTLIWSMAVQVEQNSSEDWPAVPLSLATADVRRFTPVPTLPRQTVELLPEARAQPAEQLTRSAQMQASPVDMVHDETGFATRLAPKTATSIGSGQPPAYLPVFEQTLDAQWQIEIAPQHSENAVVVARFTPDLQAPMPAGSWRLFRDQQEQAGSHHGRLTPDAQLTMSFGIDPRIEVGYQQQPDNRAVRGLVGRASQIERISSVAITNHHQQRIPVRVQMQMPIPTDEDIVVESMASTTGPTRRNVDGVENRWAYQRDLAAGGEWQIDFSYRVRWPEDRLITPF